MDAAGSDRGAGATIEQVIASDEEIAVDAAGSDRGAGATSHIIIGISSSSKMWTLLGLIGGQVQHRESGTGNAFSCATLLGLIGGQVQLRQFRLFGGIITSDAAGSDRGAGATSLLQHF